MAVQTLKLAGKKFVVLEESEYRRLQRRASTTRPRSRAALSAEDRYDIVRAKRASKERGYVTLEEVKRQAGM